MSAATHALSGPELLLALRAAALAAYGSEPATLPGLRALPDGCDTLEPPQAWPILAYGLMGPHPARMLLLLRQHGALLALLPEVDALFGVPQSADDPPEVDIGLHQCALLEETAKIDAPLATRWAALLHKLGKAGSPREFWPGHYGHEARGIPLVEAVCARFQVPEDCLALARLAVRECDRVHRAVDMRATAIAGLLERAEAPRHPERFARLLDICACDYRAYPGQALETYPKADKLRRALAAYTGVEPAPARTAAELFESRAQAVAQALRSERWTE
ncbi:tRNA nucleotidyltransferase (CCA-adding enzyme) [Methylomagnum ishizawai]|uniref:tRNA nucleotidyltransferase (CCA-adding enzyme) n=1 Tax=Methylomagnum ishizawai TaxID=1760988 RepID=A0A1Y6DA62_9GAMM|nr:hypothetical protein [Methylomagnum ishizawai]SMF97543.1 tRNA nucleotidyltransferase (CCA-adding enzyme) [Methylomagnum ishizawai]